ncbi:LysR family transcriptional regulator [Xanthomonas theicola]
MLRAAEAASMTQPAASKLLAEMEDLLGAGCSTRTRVGWSRPGTDRS